MEKGPENSGPFFDIFAWLISGNGMHRKHHSAKNPQQIIALFFRS
jgi:hypothetical protein